MDSLSYHSLDGVLLCRQILFQRSGLKPNFYIEMQVMVLNGFKFQKQAPHSFTVLANRIRKFKMNSRYNITSNGTDSFHFFF